MANSRDYILAGLADVGSGFLEGLARKRMLQQELQARAEQDRQRNRLALLEIIGRSVQSGSMSGEQGNRLLSTLFPEFAETRRIVEPAPPAPPELILPAEKIPGQAPAKIPTLEELRGGGPKTPDRTKTPVALPTAPRPMEGSIFQGTTVRPTAGIPTETVITTPGDFFQTPVPEERAKPEIDPFELAARPLDALARAGNLSPAAMKKLTAIRSQYRLDNDLNKALTALQEIEFRERPMPATMDLRLFGQKYGMLADYHRFARQTDQTINELQDNKTVKDRELGDLKKRLTALEASHAAGRYKGRENVYQDEKARLEADIRNVQDEIKKLGRDIVNYKRQNLKIKQSINQLEREVNLPGELEVKEPEIEEKIPEDLSQATTEQLLRIMLGQE